MQQRLKRIAVVRHLQAQIPHHATTNRGRRPVDIDQFLEVSPQALEGRALAVAKDLLGSFFFTANIKLKYLFREVFFTGEVVIEGPFWYIRLIENLFHASRGIAHGAYPPKPNLEEMIPRVPNSRVISSSTFARLIDQSIRCSISV